MAKTYTLNDLGVTIDDLILLQSTGYEFDENEGITEEKREEVLARIYEAKQAQKSKTPQKTPDFADLVPSATTEQTKQVKYDAKNGKEVSLQDMASVVKAETIINKDLRDQLPNVIKSAVEKDSLTPEETAALGYLLDELNGKHVEDKKNPHSIHEYNKRFADMPELLEQAAQKVQESPLPTETPAVEKTYTKEEIEELLTKGEVYLKSPTEVFGKQGEKDNVADAHTDGFVDHVAKMSALIKDYGEGKVDVAPDALLGMDKLVALYGKEYVRGTMFKNDMSYDVTQDAANAAQRVAFEKKLHGIKTPVDEETARRVQRWEKARRDVERLENYVKDLDVIIPELVVSIAYAKSEAERRQAIEDFNKKISASLDKHELDINRHIEATQDFVARVITSDENQFGMLHNEYEIASKYLLDENGKLREGVAVYITPEERIAKNQNREVVEEENKPTEQKEEYSKEEIAEAMKKKPADRSLRDWIIIKHAIQNHPTQTEGQKAYALKSLTDQARTYKMTDPKKTSDEELKDADEFMQEFGYDYDKKGRASTNPIARKWKDTIDKRIKAQEEQKVQEAPEEVKEEKRKEEEKGKGGNGSDAHIVIPPHQEGNNSNNGKTDEENNTQVKEDDKKKKKGLVGWIKDKGKKVVDWGKRNWKKIVAYGSAILLTAAVLSTKSCEGKQKDDVKKDNPEYVAPTPTPEKITESKDTPDMAMAHQYCKRMGYQEGIESDGAISKYIQDRESYSTVKDKYALHLGFDSSVSTDEQMALLATVRGDQKEYSSTVDDIIAGKKVNIASLAKIRTALSEWHREGATIQNTNPEKYTKQTGTQSIEIDQGELKKQVENAGFIAQARGNQGNS